MQTIAVVIPAFRAANTILEVIRSIGPEVKMIYVVDDSCPERTADTVNARCSDERVRTLKHSVNQGVGAAFMTGMAAALASGADIIVKVDADGQMDPALIPDLTQKIENGQADYVKGNRFYFVDSVAGMPPVRLFGNLILSFMTKVSSGYWNVMDPTNGFLAIHADVAMLLPVERIAKRFFFESDLLLELGLLKAKVVDFPMTAVYGDEVSNLKVSRVFGPFLKGHLKNTARRILYNYYLRDFSVASLELLFSLGLMLFGMIFGAYHWISGSLNSKFASTGTVMLAAVPVLLGFQLFLSFVNYDVNATPKDSVHPLLKGLTRKLGRVRPAERPKLNAGP